jgi:type IV secretion system protein VirB1
MTLTLAAVLALAQQCAPSVAPETLVSLVHTESRFDPLAIGVNARGVANPHSIDKASAVAAARALISQGYNIDLGLGQINSTNLRRLNLSIEDAFDPCRNLAAAARVLVGNYLNVSRSGGTTEAAIATALSMYNTGNRSRGFGNGYVARVYASSGMVVPALRGGAAHVGDAPRGATQGTPTPPLPARIAPVAQVAWDTSAGAQTASMMVFGGASSTSPKGRSE